MKITFDPSKRDLTLKHRGLDFARAGEVFAGQTATIVDDRFDYGEMRFITAGHLDGRLVVTVWTPKARSRASSTHDDDEAQHIISMRHCHAKEEKVWRRRMEGSG
jgi:uncharacterized DUF497 family protein